MKYPLLLLAIPLFACSAAQSEQQGPQIVNVSGSDEESCQYKIGDSQDNIAGFDSTFVTGRDVLIKADPAAAYQCVTLLQDELNDRALTVKIDEDSWSKLASVEAGVFKPTAEIDHPEAKLFDKERSAVGDVEAAIEKADRSGNNLILVMGANWCHDSRGLAGWFETPRFARMLAEKYEVAYIDVGYRDRNIDIAKRFGIKEIKGTPTVLVLSPDGKLLNEKSARTWRNAASRSEDDIFDYFSKFTPEI